MTQEQRSAEKHTGIQEALGAVKRLADASRRLYLSGGNRPGCPAISTAELADLWHELGEALGIAPATGSASYFCTSCASTFRDICFAGAIRGTADSQDIRKPTTLLDITETPAPIPECALGSGKFPAVIDLHDGKYCVLLGTVVTEAIKLSGYSILAWNAICQDSRDNYIERVIRRLRSAAGRA